MKEIEEWIEQNNPYCNDREVSAWEEGAKEMAYHLQRQPPTFEQLNKAINLIASCHLSKLENESEFVFNCRLHEYILKNWNDEE